MATDGVPFVKGHGTENDFVLLPDADATLDLTDRRAAALCDRRAGVGADGVLRVVPTASQPEVVDQAAVAEWFMDHRNADGSTAEMCGNGVRVFVRYLLGEGLASGSTVTVATRGGPREVSVDETLDARPGDLAVDMGAASATSVSGPVHVQVDRVTWLATGVLVPNPHAVVFVDRLSFVGDLTNAPRVTPAKVFPDGVNVEFVADVGPAHVAMRVHERGVGETRSCGTGACAVAWAARRRPGADAPSTWTVDVPGGRLRVTERDDGHLVLSGPATLVASGQIHRTWWEENR
ncbi:MAG: diaminopimelate epimerase [Actinomycetes bacterium]